MEQIDLLRVLFAAVNVADGVLTYKILRGGGSELMPAADSLIKRFGAKSAMLGLKIAAIVGVWVWSFNGLDPRVLAGMCAAFGGIVVWNYFQYRRGT